MRVGILGCGNVGAALVQLIDARRDEIAARTGLRLEVARVAVRSLTRERPVDLPADVLTRDASEVIDDPAIDVVVEVIGGIEPARELILQALKSGKPVVTANKELLANHGAELYAGVRLGRRRPAVRGGRRRRHPDHAADARVARRARTSASSPASSTARRTSSSPA